MDIERIEIVRGLRQPLGPGVESGVVHFFSKKAIDKPGTSVELIGGNLSTLQGAIDMPMQMIRKPLDSKLMLSIKKVMNLV